MVRKIIIRSKPKTRPCGEIVYSDRVIEFKLGFNNSKAGYYSQVHAMKETLKQYLSDLGFIVEDKTQDIGHGFNPKSRLSRQYSSHQNWMKRKEAEKRD